MAIEPGTLVAVVRNTLGLPCVGKSIGLTFTAQTFDDDAGHRWWFAGGPCPHCGSGQRDIPEVDLQPIRGDGTAKSVPTETQRPALVEA